MQIDKSGTALYAMQKAMEQPQLLLDILQKSVQPEQTLAAQSKSVIEGSEVAAMTGKGQKIDIVV